MNAEDRFVSLRTEGYSRARAADELGIPMRKAAKYDDLFIAQSSGYGTDATVPKFADHDAHLAALSRFVGFDAVARLMLRMVAA